MIFFNQEEERLLTPLILDYERVLEINQVPILTITTASVPIVKNDRVVFFDDSFKPHEFIVAEVTEIKDNGYIRQLYCLGSESTLAGKFIDDKRPQGNADAALEVLLNGTEFTVGSSDVTKQHNNNFYRESALESFSELLSNYEAEYETSYTLSDKKVTTRKINLKKSIGKDLGKRCSYKKDMTRIERKTLKTPVVTRLYPFGKGEEVGEGFGRRITIESVNDGKTYLEDDELRKVHGIGKEKLHYESYEIFENIEEPQKLKEAAIELFEKLKVQQVTYAGNILDMVAMGFPQEGVSLGDWVYIQDYEFKPPLEVKARVVKLVEKTGHKYITLGNYVPFFEESQKDTKNKLKAILDKVGGWDNAAKTIEEGSYLDNVLDAVNDQLNTVGGWAKLIPGRGIVVPNADNEEDATWIVEIGGGFIRYANSRKSDGSWDYRNISDANGVIADSITTGLLKGGKVKWNFETGTFLIGNSAEDYHFFYDGATLRMQNVDIDISNNEIITELQDGLTSAQSSIEANATAISSKLSKTQILTDTEIQEVLKGEKGDKGEDAPEKYTWYRWADTPTSGISENPLNKDYLGIAYDKPTPTPSNNYDDYDWVLVKGERGADGVSPDDKFFWVKYADDDNGTGMSDSPVGKRWLGVAENRDTLIESNDYRDYKWSPLYDNSVIMSDTAPSNPNVAQLWLDTSQKPNLLKRWDESEWEIISDTTTIESLLESKANIEDVGNQLANIAATLREELGSEISQTNDTVSIRFTEAIEAINATGDLLTELSTNLETNIRFTAEGIELGRTDNPVSIKILPDRVSFSEGGQEVAYFSNNALHVTDIHVLANLRIGNFAFIPRSSGNLSFRKVT